MKRSEVSSGADKQFGSDPLFLTDTQYYRAREAVQHAVHRPAPLHDEMQNQSSPYQHPVTVWRLSRKLSVAELAALTGVTEADIRSIECGCHEVSVICVMKVAEALDLCVSHVIAAQRSAPS